MFSGRPASHSLAPVAHNLRRFRSVSARPSAVSLAFSPFGIANYRSGRGCLEALLASPLKSPQQGTHSSGLQFSLLPYPASFVRYCGCVSHCFAKTIFKVQDFRHCYFFPPPHERRMNGCLYICKLCRRGSARKENGEGSGGEAVSDLSGEVRLRPGVQLCRSPRGLPGPGRAHCVLPRRAIN